MCTLNYLPDKQNSMPPSGPAQEVVKVMTMKDDDMMGYLGSEGYWQVPFSRQAVKLWLFSSDLITCSLFLTKQVLHFRYIYNDWKRICVKK